MDLSSLPLDRLSPSLVWPELDAETRLLAARALYANEDRGGRAEADHAIATTLRYRPAAVRKLPVDSRVTHLVSRVRPDDSLASSLLLALHLGHRRAILGAFLDALEIPHKDGLIDESYELEPVGPEPMSRAVGALYDGFERAEVEIYLASLLAMDRELWGSIAEVVAAKS